MLSLHSTQVLMPIPTLDWFALFLTWQLFMKAFTFVWPRWNTFISHTPTFIKSFFFFFFTFSLLSGLVNKSTFVAQFDLQLILNAWTQACVVFGFPPPFNYYFLRYMINYIIPHFSYLFQLSIERISKDFVRPRASVKKILQIFLFYLFFVHDASYSTA